jgi:prepilin-type processing-associated H-X9-DG protein
MAARRRFVRLFLSPTFLIGLGTFVLLTSLVAGAVRSARHAAKTASCNCHLKQLGIALQNYHDTYKCYPPAYIADANGKPMHSWRVLILPFMCEKECYDKYRFDEPWNGPHNRELANEFGSHIYRCPAADGYPSETSYVAVVGPETGWPAPNCSSVPDFTDGTSDTIAMVEVANSGIHWMEPRDLTFEEASEGISASPTSEHISSPHGTGANFLFFDSHVDYVPLDTPPERLRGLLTRNGGEDVEPLR